MVKRARTWSREAIEHLRDLEAHYPSGRVVLFPIIKDWGQSIVWDSRIYVKGAAGVLPVSVESLGAIGCPEPEKMVETTEKALAALARLYPVMLPELAARVKALEAAAPALPVGEREGEHEWR